eukprot:119642-Chlamydomonas_euryale.AAC.1
MSSSYGAYLPGRELEREVSVELRQSDLRDAGGFQLCGPGLRPRVPWLAARVPWLAARVPWLAPRVPWLVGAGKLCSR